MTATAIATGPDLKAELTLLAREISELSAKRKTAQAALDTLTNEKSSIAERIASGKEKPAAAEAIERQLEQARAGVDGLAAIIKRQEARAAAIRPTVRHQVSLEQRAEREATVRKLEAAGAEIAARINDKLYSVLGVELPALDAIRDQLIRDFQADGGFAASERLIKLFIAGDTVSVAEKKLKQEGLRRRSDIQIGLHNLAKPQAPRMFSRPR